MGGGDAKARTGSPVWPRCWWTGAVEGLGGAAAGAPISVQVPFRRVQAHAGQMHTRGFCNNSSLQMTMPHFWGCFVVFLNSDVTT